MNGETQTVRNGTNEATARKLKPFKQHTDPKTGTWARVYVGDCRELIPRIPECVLGKIDLIFADPPFNWNRAYDEWDDALPDDEYVRFTKQWLDLCVRALAPNGSMWVNIPDDWAAEIVVHLKGDRDADGNPRDRLHMVNWCIWHYRFGQNTTQRFINSKVHALYFARHSSTRVWNPQEILEPSDRATTYFDPRTLDKADGMPPGKRVPLDVWYGKHWGRIQGNNKERRRNHDNQLPEAYLERVIRACSNKGQIVMDPFLGSGTTGVIAHALERHFIGCEYSRANAASAWERITVKGPIRLGESLGQSTAIFPARKRRAKAAAAAD